MRVTVGKFNNMIKAGLFHQLSKKDMEDLEVEHTASDRIKVIISVKNYPVLEINNMVVKLTEAETDVIHNTFCNDLHGKEMQKTFKDLRGPKGDSYDV